MLVSDSKLKQVIILLASVILILMRVIVEYRDLTSLEIISLIPIFSIAGFLFYKTVK